MQRRVAWERGGCSASPQRNLAPVPSLMLTVGHMSHQDIHLQLLHRAASPAALPAALPSPCAQEFGCVAMTTLQRRPAAPSRAQVSVCAVVLGRAWAKLESVLQTEHRSFPHRLHLSLGRSSKRSILRVDAAMGTKRGWG